MDKKILAEKTIKLYSNTGWKYLFAKIRFFDAPFLKVEKLLPRKGRITDLGCGEGIFTNFLGLASKDRKILGIELDQKRVGIADCGLKNVSFKKADATKTGIPKSEAIILFHLLHHLNSFQEQEKLISKCAKSLSKGGRLVVVEAERNLSLKFILTYLTDCFLVPWVFEKKFYSPIYFRTGNGWKNVLEKMGFSCRVIKADKGMPFTHIILICSIRKK